MTTDLTEAADTVAELERYLSDVAYYGGPDPSTIHGVQEKLRRLVDVSKTLVELAKAYAAELDSTLVDEQWLRENCKRREFAESPEWEIFHEQQYLMAIRPRVNGDGLYLVWKGVHFAHPTRGLVRTLQRIGGGM